MEPYDPKRPTELQRFLDPESWKAMAREPGDAAAAGALGALDVGGIPSGLMNMLGVAPETMADYARLKEQQPVASTGGQMMSALLGKIGRGNGPPAEEPAPAPAYEPPPTRVDMGPVRLPTRGGDQVTYSSRAAVPKTGGEPPPTPMAPPAVRGTNEMTLAQGPTSMSGAPRPPPPTASAPLELPAKVSNFEMPRSALSGLSREELMAVLSDLAPSGSRKP